MVRNMLKILTKNLLQTMSIHVHKHNLFEQKGERPRSKKFSNSPLHPHQNQTHAQKETSDITRTTCSDIQNRMNGPHWKIFIHWATWCEGCIEEIPIIQDLLQVLSEIPSTKKIDIYGIGWDNFMFHNIEQAHVEVEAFYKEHTPPFPTGILTDSDEVFFEFFSMSQKKIPQIWLIDPEGTQKIFPEGIGLEEIIEIQNEIQNEQN